MYIAFWAHALLVVAQGTIGNFPKAYVALEPAPAAAPSPGTAAEAPQALVDAAAQAQSESTAAAAALATAEGKLSMAAFVLPSMGQPSLCTHDLLLGVQLRWK